MANMLDIAAGSDDLTPEEIRASDLDRDVRRACQEIRRVWIYLAGDLYEVHHDRHWERLGFDSFEAWLADPIIDMNPRHVYRMMQVWRELVVDRGVPPEALEAAEVTKVAMVLPAIRSGQRTADEALSDASVLSRSDLHEGYVNGDSHAPLNAEDEPEFHDCPDCGRPHKAKR